MTGGNTKQRVVRFVGVGLLAIGCSKTAMVGQANAQYARGPVRDSDHRFQEPVCSWLELERYQVVMQKRDFSCGAAALATVLRYYWGDNVTEDQILKALDKLLTREEALDRIKNGLSLTDLRRAAVESGYLATMGRLSFEKLAESKVPLIVGVIVDDYDHFVVYRGTDWEWVYLADPARGNIRVPVCEFGRQWQKNAVLAVAKRGEKVKDPSPMCVRQDEVSVGHLNWQHVRTRPSRDFSR